MKFEIGKYYKRVSNPMRALYVIAEAEDSYYWFGPTLIGVKSGCAELMPLGSDTDSTVGYEECSKEDWEKACRGEGEVRGEPDNAGEVPTP